MIQCIKPALKLFGSGAKTRSAAYCVLNQWNTGRFLSWFSRTDVTIPVPIVQGHLAAQLWKGKENPGSKPYTPIICMHGSLDNSGSFDPLIPLIIRGNMTIVAVDWLGHGLSSHSPGASYDIMTDGIAKIQRVMRHYNWDKVSLIGHSVGSTMCFVFSSCYPDKIERYVAIDAMHGVTRDIWLNTKEIVDTLFDVEEKLCGSSNNKPAYSYDDMLKRVSKVRKGTITDEGIKILLKRGARPDPRSPNMFQFTHDLKTTIPAVYFRFTREQSVELAKHVKCPVCVIKGDPGEDYEPREKFMETLEVVKAANGGKLEFHLVSGTHHVHLNDPHLVAPIISNFLEATFP